MKKLFTIILLVIVITGFTQNERFFVVDYKINDKYLPQFESSSNAMIYANFMLYKERSFFLLEINRDSTYSYGYIKKDEEYDVELQDSANLVIYNAYTWNYANSYNYNTGVAKIETYRIFYKTQMHILITIHVDKESKKEDKYDIEIIAINEDY